MGTNIFRAVNSTLIYLERGDEYLMLHRTKKENDLNHDKWIGVGGKFEDGRVARGLRPGAKRGRRPA